MKFFYAALTVGLQIAHVLECEMKSENGQWGKWNASETHVLISGNQGCSLSLQLLTLKTLSVLAITLKQFMVQNRHVSG